VWREEGDFPPTQKRKERVWREEIPAHTEVLINTATAAVDIPAHAHACNLPRTYKL
jgi:hypothetical protein